MNNLRPNTVVKKEIVNIGNQTLLIVRLANSTLKVGDMCQDDNGNLFTVKSVVHYKFPDKIPKWYLETPEFQLVGDSFTIGEYLIKITNSMENNK